MIKFIRHKQDRERKLYAVEKELASGSVKAREILPDGTLGKSKVILKDAIIVLNLFQILVLGIKDLWKSIFGNKKKKK